MFHFQRSDILAMELNLIVRGTHVGNEHKWIVVIFEVTAFITVEIECFIS